MLHVPSVSVISGISLNYIPLNVLLKKKLSVKAGFNAIQSSLSTYIKKHYYATSKAVKK